MLLTIFLSRTTTTARGITTVSCVSGVLLSEPDCDKVPGDAGPDIALGHRQLGSHC